MKILLIATLFLMPQTQPQTPRDYYNEIYKAGGLDNFADGDVDLMEFLYQASERVYSTTSD